MRGNKQLHFPSRSTVGQRATQTGLVRNSPLPKPEHVAGANGGCTLRPLCCRLDALSVVAWNVALSGRSHAGFAQNSETTCSRWASCFPTCAPRFYALSKDFVAPTRSGGFPAPQPPGRHSARYKSNTGSIGLALIAIFVTLLLFSFCLASSLNHYQFSSALDQRARRQ